MDDIGVFGVVAQTVDWWETDGAGEAAALPVWARRPEHVGEVALILRHDLIREEFRHKRAVRADFRRKVRHDAQVLRLWQIRDIHIIRAVLQDDLAAALDRGHVIRYLHGSPQAGLQRQVRLGLELLEMPVFLLCLESRIVDSRMAPFRRVRADLEDAVEVEPDREVIALRPFCLGMLINLLIFLRRQPLLVEADLADAAGQMREVLRRPISGMT